MIESVYPVALGLLKTPGEMGADIATIPYKVMEQLIKHPLTDIGLEKFLADWNKQGK